MASVFTLAEVSEHNTSKDCWLVISGKVYDVTKFLEDHPGGDEVLVSSTGKDATAEFDDVGHSHEAWAMLEKFYVGELNKSSIASKGAVSLQGYNRKSKKKMYIIYLIKFLLPLILFNLLLAFYSKSST
ncbi:Cytochrome b5 isoform B [Striga hermonthica]|uniref:Cytochrome b5 isoform B n=1 Tax=Striga hermonthica TaxID=68872 RepID=A0A9N7P1M4_STRHE|nr:Cytochrome b5 isoform B [Striga hermonthica]